MEKLLECESLFEHPSFGTTFLGPPNAGTPNSSVENALQTQVQLLKRLVEELKAKLARRENAASEDAASILASELERAQEVKHELLQARAQLEQENQMLWMERYIMSQLLGLDTNAQDGSLIACLAAQMQAVKQGQQAAHHLQCLGQQLKLLAEPARDCPKDVLGPGRLLRRSSSSMGLRSVFGAPQAPPSGHHHPDAHHPQQQQQQHSTSTTSSDTVGAQCADHGMATGRLRQQSAGAVVMGAACTSDLLMQPGQPTRGGAYLGNTMLLPAQATVPGFVGNSSASAAASLQAEEPEQVPSRSVACTGNNLLPLLQQPLPQQEALLEQATADVDDSSWRSTCSSLQQDLAGWTLEEPQTPVQGCRLPIQGSLDQPNYALMGGLVAGAEPGAGSPHHATGPAAPTAARGCGSQGGCMSVGEDWGGGLEVWEQEEQGVSKEGAPVSRELSKGVVAVSEWRASRGPDQLESAQGC